MPPSVSRLEANPVYDAEYIVVGSHLSQAIGATAEWFAKPNTATHFKLQALTQNVRYRIDDQMADSSTGFQLSAGADTVIPVSGNGVSVAREAAGATIEGQWIR